MVSESDITDENHGVDSNRTYHKVKQIANTLRRVAIYTSKGSKNNAPPFISGLNKSHGILRNFEYLLSKKAELKGKSSFLVYKDGKYITIQTKNIAFFYINNETPTIMLFDKTIYPIAFSLDEVTKLVAITKFFRINRQYLLSYAAIKEVEHYFSRKLLVKLKFPTQEKLLVGRNKTTAFLNWFGNR